jgi:hypothetical protein
MAVLAVSEGHCSGQQLTVCSKVDVVPQCGELGESGILAVTLCVQVACMWIVLAVKLNQAMQCTAQYSARWCSSTASWVGAGCPGCRVSVDGVL